MSDRGRRCRRVTTSAATTSPPTRSAPSTTPEAARASGAPRGLRRVPRQLRWLEPAVDLLPASVEQLRAAAAGPRGSLLETVRAEATAAARRAAPRACSRALVRTGWRRRLSGGPATGGRRGRDARCRGRRGLPDRRAERPSGTTTLEAQADRPRPEDAPAGLAGRVDGNSGILSVQRTCRPLPERQVYEVWVQRGGKIEPSSHLRPRTQRQRRGRDPGRLDGADAVLVTQEPRGGSQQPTTCARAAASEVDQPAPTGHRS